MKRCLACAFAFDANGWKCPKCSWKSEAVNGRYLFAPELARHEAGPGRVSVELLPVVQAASFWFRSRNRLLTWALGEYFPEARTFFEIGCGTGFVLEGIRKAFPQLALAGGDVSLDALDVAARRVPQAQLFQLDACRVPYEAEFDVVGALDVLEHVEEDDRVLAEAHRAIRTGGGLLVSVPQHPWLWSGVDEFSRHRRRYVRTELATKLRRAGFSLLRSTSFVSLLLPAMALSRRRQPGGTCVDPAAEYRQGPLLRAMLEKVMDLERACIRVGISFPFGGSLLAVARRR